MTTVYGNSGCIECTKTNWQQLNVWTTYPLLNSHIVVVNPSLIKKQDNTPAFPLTARTLVTIRSYGCEAGNVHTRVWYVTFSQDSDRQIKLLSFYSRWFRTSACSSSHLFGSELAFPIIAEGRKGLSLHLLLSLFAFVLLQLCIHGTAFLARSELDV